MRLQIWKAARREKQKMEKLQKKSRDTSHKTTPPEGDMKETEHTGLPLIYQLVTLIHIVLSRPIWSYFMGNIWTTQQLD